ncbi:DUF1566 domain-containing protein [Flavobacteriales bacterium]|nr:DUF1566 domain-containing protein [Flavobacteriales bacterium]MDB2653105.1 DUF1566 domain-containing protein [Flavobacteriales bacterium]
MKKLLSILLLCFCFLNFNTLFSQDIEWPTDIAEVNTGANSTYLVQSSNIDGTPLVFGYVLGAFYTDDAGNLKCGGFANCSSSQHQLVVWGDDVLTPAKEGFAEGESITWLAYNNFLDQTYSASIEATSATANLYTINSFNVVTAFNVSGAVSGCNDSIACNFNTNATEDDGTCAYPAENFNCDGSCLDTDGDAVCDLDEIIGCQDASACNYNTMATDSSLCVFATGDCDSCSGDTDGTGTVVDNDVDNDGVCNADELGTCTDETACNYNNDSTVETDDLLCVYATEACETCSGELDGTGSVIDNDSDNDGICNADEISGCQDATACNYDATATDSDGLCEGLFGCTDSTYYEYNQEATCDNNSCSTLIVFGCTDSAAFNFNANATEDDGSCIAVIEGCTDASAFNFNELANTDDGTCYKYGCISEWADNYDELATDDDGSCYKYGCISEWADNYDELATDDDGSCELVACNYPYFFEYDSNYTISDPLLCITLIVEGCTNSDAENYNEEANLDDGSCVVFGCMNQEAENYNPDATIQDNSCVYYGCTNETAENYNEQATDNDGSCIIYGCVLSVFPNYNPEATIDDNSCSFDGLDIYGCTDQGALNYESQATQDNGSCLFNEEVESCSYTIEEEYIPLELYIGWGMFGYTCTDAIDVSVAFESITENILLVKENGGEIYFPEFNFNGIGDLVYSRGYQINMIEEVTDFSFCPTLIVTENIPQREVGDLAEGGIVFYVDETGEHGLVAAMEDLTEGATDPNGWGYNGYEWGCYDEYVNGADGTSIGTGYQNTLDIVAGCSETPIAASEALAYESEAYSDWYLPSKDELMEMYNTIGNGSPEGDIGGFGNNYYWSSSEYSYNVAWYVYFDNGDAGSYLSKYFANRVRVIRAF